MGSDTAGGLACWRRSNSVILRAGEETLQHYWHAEENQNILALNQQGSFLMRKVAVGQKIKSEVGFAINKGSVLMRQVTAGHEIKSKVRL